MFVSIWKNVVCEMSATCEGGQVKGHLQVLNLG